MKKDNSFLQRRVYKFILSAFAASLILPTTAWTKVEYDSNRLQMMNTDEINNLVRRRLKKAQDITAKSGSEDKPEAEPEAIEQMISALRIVLARPDQDGTRNNAFSRLRRELSDMNSFESTLDALAEEAIQGIKDSGTPNRHKATYLMVLEGLMVEIKPDVQENETLRKIIEKIRDADLKVPEAVQKQQRLRSMSRPSSPSETAAKIVPKGKKK